MVHAIAHSVIHLLVSASSNSGDTSGNSEALDLPPGVLVRTKCKVDRPLASQIAYFLLTEKATSVFDLGCGCGQYLQIFHAFGLRSFGVDLNPHAPILSAGLCSVGDLSRPLNLHSAPYDWSISLEVAEHVSGIFEAEYLQNIYRCGSKGVIISWAGRGQTGRGHVNNRNSGEIQEIFTRIGYAYDESVSGVLRSHAGKATGLDSSYACCGHFRTNLHVFRRMQASDVPPPWTWLPDFLGLMTDHACRTLYGIHMTDRVLEDADGNLVLELEACFSCIYSFRPKAHTVGAQVLRTFSSEVSLAWIDRFCCSEGQIRCSGYEVDEDTGERRLLENLRTPKSWRAIQPNKMHESGIYVKVVQGSHYLSRDEHENDTMSFWPVSRTRKLNREELASMDGTCLGAFDHHWVRFSGAPAFVEGGKGRLLDEAELCAEERGKYVIFDTDMPEIASLSESLSLGVCVPPTPFCSSEDYVMVGWHYVVRHALSLSETRDGFLARPKTFRAHMEMDLRRDR